MEENEILEYKNQYKKIRFLGSLADEIAYVGVQCGAEKLMDYIDLNCGAIPDGDFECVIDLDAAKQFLKLYTATAESRFAFAVTALMQMNEGAFDAVSRFCAQVGETHRISKVVKNAEEALDIFDSLILVDCYDNEDCKKNIISMSDDKVQWTYKNDPHKKYWEKTNGDLKVYYLLQEQFVNSAIAGTTFKYEVTLESTGIKDDKNCAQTRVFTLKRA